MACYNDNIHMFSEIYFNELGYAMIFRIFTYGNRMELTMHNSANIHTYSINIKNAYSRAVFEKETIHSSIYSKDVAEIFDRLLYVLHGKKRISNTLFNELTDTINKLRQHINDSIIICIGL